MNLKARLGRLEESTAVAAVPILITFTDGTCYAGGRRTTREAWEDRYREQIARERARGRRIFGINFQLNEEEADEQAQAD